MEYTTAFDGASRASIRIPEPHDKVPVEEQLDIGAVVTALRSKGIDAVASPDTEVLVRQVIAEAQVGDVVLVMSNGAFGGFIPTLLDGLRHRFE